MWNHVHGNCFNQSGLTVVGVAELSWLKIMTRLFQPQQQMYPFFIIFFWQSSL